MGMPRKLGFLYHNFCTTLLKRLDLGTRFTKKVHSADSACGDANVELHGTLRSKAVPGHLGAAGHQPQRDG